MDPDGMEPQDFSINVHGNDVARDKPLFIASTFIDPSGKVLKHISDSDKSVYLVSNPNEWNGKKDGLIVVGTEKEEVDYNRMIGMVLGPLTYNAKEMNLVTGKPKGPEELLVLLLKQLEILGKRNSAIESEIISEETLIKIYTAYGSQSGDPRHGVQVARFLIIEDAKRRIGNLKKEKNENDSAMRYYKRGINKN